MIKFIVRRTIAVTLLCFCAAAAFGQGVEFQFQGVEIFRDVLWLGNSETDSAPSPILGVWGAAAKFKLTERFFFLPEIGLYGIEYFYRDGKALPAEIEYADAVGTLVVLLDPLVAYNIPLPGGKLAVLAGTGPALSIKIPIVPHGDAPTSEVGGYFFEKLRFLHWEFKGVLEWNLTDSLGLSVRLRTLLPIYRFWDGEGSPIYDGLMAGAGVGFRIRL